MSFDHLFRFSKPPSPPVTVLGLEGQVEVSSLPELYVELRRVHCRDINAAVKDFVLYGVAKVWDWRSAERNSPYKTVSIRRRPIGT